MAEVTRVRSAASPVTAQRAGRPGHGRRPRWSRYRILLWWALPAVLLVLGFRYVPMLSAAGYAFTDWDGLSANPTFVGLDNFREIVTEGPGRRALVNTVVLAGVFVLATNGFGMALAVGLHSIVKSRNLIRAVFFLPVVLSPLATAYIWRFIYQIDGPLNQLLGAVGLDSLQRSWLADPTWALWTVWVVMVWQFAGLSMVIYLAGLQGVPVEIIEAAAVDGASAWHRFRRITLPMLAPATTIAMTLSVIYSLGVFDQVVALTGGGPAGATETLATQVYQQTFVSGRFGYGTALSLVLTALITVVAVTQLGLLRRRERRL